jgi:hypothetical protein
VPGHDPVVAVGVTIYCTDPAVVLLGLVSVWLIVEPEPALAPVTLPVTVPIVHVKLLATLEVKAMFVPAPLQIIFVEAFVTVGAGLTVTVIVKAVPTHDPVVEVGVTMYCTVPAAELLGLVSVWLIVEPLPAVAPVIPPVIVPIVQLKLLGTLEVKAILGDEPLHTLPVDAFVTAGFGFTVTVMV